MVYGERTYLFDDQSAQAMSNEYQGLERAVKCERSKRGMKRGPKVFQVLKAVAVWKTGLITIYHDAGDNIAILVAQGIWE
ncbi:hypothetical protein CCMA1212_006955 [Trichoderma ghanense]|uniref:Fungal-type protein kinase domain-containing protein n=1 Tax=Trichoderma ghanense TaxID=65468 RepID=A0ABY2GYU8_9HYPO